MKVTRVISIDLTHIVDDVESYDGPLSEYDRQKLANTIKRILSVEDVTVKNVVDTVEED